MCSAPETIFIVAEMVLLKKSVYVLSVGMYVHHGWAECPQKPGESIGTPGTGVQDSCELPCECWESNLASLEEQSTFFLTAETSLQPHMVKFNDPI